MQRRCCSFFIAVGSLCIRNQIFHDGEVLTSVRHVARLKHMHIIEKGTSSHARSLPESNQCGDPTTRATEYILPDLAASMISGTRRRVLWSWWLMSLPFLSTPRSLSKLPVVLVSSAAMTSAVLSMFIALRKAHRDGCRLFVNALHNCFITPRSSPRGHHLEGRPCLRCQSLVASHSC